MVRVNRAVQGLCEESNVVADAEGYNAGLLVVSGRVVVPEPIRRQRVSFQEAVASSVICLSVVAHAARASVSV